MHLNLHSTTEAQLQKIKALYTDDEQFAQSIIAYQKAELSKAIVGIQLDLHTFEKHYQMSIEVFYHRFQAGELEDSDDFMLWAGSHELLQKNQAKLSALDNA